jgi:pimeloyl-ACP methyl ester carboxylesterase
VRRAGLLFIALGLGCTTPAEKFTQTAITSGLTRTEIIGVAFSHIVFTSVPRDLTGMHIYLDGDGTPWQRPGQIATDPSARESLVLDLIARDPALSILVGRPCYYHSTMPPNCAVPLWTSHRYSETVVASIAAVIETLIATHPDKSVTLVGHSGGGALAVLIAPRLSRVDAVITIGANLDIAAWTTHHAYSPLTGSLNPVDQPPLDPGIQQGYLYGAEDSQVPVATAARFFAKSGQVAPEIVAGFDHHCCWADSWLAILRQFEAKR